MPHQLYGLKAMEFHAFMNPTPTALRVMMMSLGTQSSPIFRSRHYFYGNHAVYASGEAKISAQEESPALQQIWQSLRASTNS
jgi:hypothetical protein